MRNSEHEGISIEPSPDDVFEEGSKAAVHSKPDPFQATISLPKWCRDLVTSVFRTRTVFGAFVRHAIQLPRDGSKVSSSPAFPVPIPYFCVC